MTAPVDVRVRQATSDDARAIADVFIASFGSLTFLPRLHTDDEHRAFIANVVLTQQDILVAREDGRVAGFIAMAHGNFVEHLYVHPERQRRGIGTALLSEAKARMPGGFRLWVFQENEEARRFYERNGLVVVELTDGSGNEEKTPDALYEWPREGTPRRRRVEGWRRGRRHGRRRIPGRTAGPSPGG